MEEANKITENINEEKTPAKNTTSSGVPLKTIVLIVILALVAGLLTYIAVSPKKSLPVVTSVVTTKTNPADTTLSIKPSVKDTKTSTYSSIIYVDTGKNSIVGAQVELEYDPAVVTNVSITPLEFLPSLTEIYKKIDQTNGRITYAIGVSVGESGVKGKGSLAKITYTVIPGQQANASFNFLPKTEVSGEGSDQSFLKSTADGEINIESN